MNDFQCLFYYWSYFAPRSILKVLKSDHYRAAYFRAFHPFLVEILILVLASSCHARCDVGKMFREAWNLSQYGYQARVNSTEPRRQPSSGSSLNFSVQHLLGARSYVGFSVGELRDHIFLFELPSGICANSKPPSPTKSKNSVFTNRRNKCCVKKMSTEK